MNMIPWLLIRIIFVIVSLLAFSPLVIPANTFMPEMYGIPYTLWVGFLVSVCLLVIIILGTLFMPSDGDEI